MVDWKIYIDSAQQRALDFCDGSFDEGDGFGDGFGFGDGDGEGWGYGNGEGNGAGCGFDARGYVIAADYGNGWGNGELHHIGRSAREW